MSRTEPLLPARQKCPKIGYLLGEPVTCLGDKFRPELAEGADFGPPASWNLVFRSLNRKRPSFRPFVGSMSVEWQINLPFTNRLGAQPRRFPWTQSTSATSATFVATSSSDDSAVFSPERDASNGLTCRNASNVVPCATGMTRSVASSADSSLSAIPSD